MTLTGLPTHWCSFLLLLWTWLFLLISGFDMRMARQHRFDCKLPWLKQTATQPFLNVYTEPTFTNSNSHLQPGWTWNKEDSVWSLHPTEKQLKLSLRSESYQSCLSSCKHMQHMQHYKKERTPSCGMKHTQQGIFWARVYPCDPPLHICVDAKRRADSLTSWWAHWEIRLREEGALHFKNRKDMQMQGKHQQSLLYKETRIFSAPANLVYNLDFTICYLLDILLCVIFVCILHNSNSLRGVLPGEESKLPTACPSMKGTRTLLLWQDYIHRRVITVILWICCFKDASAARTNGWPNMFRFLVLFDGCAFMSMQMGPQKVFIPVAGQAQQLVCTAFTCFAV